MNSKKLSEAISEVILYHTYLKMIIIIRTSILPPIPM